MMGIDELTIDEWRMTSVTAMVAEFVNHQSPIVIRHCHPSSVTPIPAFRHTSRLRTSAPAPWAAALHAGRVGGAARIAGSADEGVEAGEGVDLRHAAPLDAAEQDRPDGRGRWGRPTRRRIPTPRPSSESAERRLRLGRRRRGPRTRHVPPPRQPAAAARASPRSGALPTRACRPFRHSSSSGTRAGGSRHGQLARAQAVGQLDRGEAGRPFLTVWLQVGDYSGPCRLRSPASPPS